MNQKALALKLLYFGVGLLPLLVIGFISKQNLTAETDKYFWYGLLGAAMLVSYAVQHVLRKMGAVNPKEAGTFLVYFSVVALAYAAFQLL
jgi:hypothetical protein